MKIFTLIRIEFLKLKRSQILLMTLLCPLSVVVLQFLMVIENSGQAITDKGWGMYWMGAISLWYMFMLPLYISLVTMLMNAVEHKNSTWRLMASMPIPQWQLYLTKGLVSWLFVFFSSIVMYGLTSLSIFIMTLIGYEGQDSFSSPFLLHLAKVMLTSLPIVLIGHMVSWRWKSVIAPLALGVVMTMTAMTLANSAEYWMFNPWTYNLIATLVNDGKSVIDALTYSAILSVILLMGSTLWLGRKEVNL